MATTASVRILARLDLPSTTAYERGRAAYLQYLTIVKQRRRVRLGPHAALLFENLETVRAQILEVLRAEGDSPRRRVQLADEYACLLPVTGELRATLFIDGEVIDVGRSLVRGAQRYGGLELRTTLGTFASAPADSTNDAGAVHYLAFAPAPVLTASPSWRLRALATDDSDAMIDVAVDDAVRDALCEELDAGGISPGWQVFASRPLPHRSNEATPAWPF